MINHHTLLLVEESILACKRCFSKLSNFVLNKMNMFGQNWLFFVIYYPNGPKLIAIIFTVSGESSRSHGHDQVYTFSILLKRIT